MILSTIKCAMRKTFSFAHDAVYKIVNGRFYLILRIGSLFSPMPTEYESPRIEPVSFNRLRKPINIKIFMIKYMQIKIEFSRIIYVAQRGAKTVANLWVIKP